MWLLSPAPAPPFRPEECWFCQGCSPPPCPLQQGLLHHRHSAGEGPAILWGRLSLPQGWAAGRAAGLGGREGGEKGTEVGGPSPRKPFLFSG